jgi:hypothetical protein
MADRPTDPEEKARVHLTNFEKFLIRVWRHGAGGKAALLLIYFAYGLPFLFNVAVLIIVTVTVWPIASSVTEKMAVLGFLFLVLNAVAYQVRGVAESVLTVMFLTRKRHRGTRAIEGP